MRANGMLQNNELQAEQSSDFWHILQECKMRIIIFGGGNSGVWTYHLLRRRGFDNRIAGFIDNSKSKQADGCLGLPVWPVDSAASQREKFLFVVPEGIYYQEMRKQLLSEGIDPNWILKGKMPDMWFGWPKVEKDAVDHVAYNASPVHFSIFGMCVSRDIVGFNKNPTFMVDRFVQDINVLSLDYESPAEQYITEENAKGLFRNPEETHFNIRNTLLDWNKTAYEYIFKEQSDYFMIDAGCLRFPLMICRRLHRAVTKILFERVRYCDDCQYKPVETMNMMEPEFRCGMEKIVRRILDHYATSRVILIETYQVNRFVDIEKRRILDFEELDVFCHDNVVQGNQGIYRGFQYLRKKMPNAHLIPFLSNTLADEAHPWKLARLHYVPEYYEYADLALKVIISNVDRPQQEMQEIENLRYEYERKIEERYGYKTVSKYLSVK